MMFTKMVQYPDTHLTGRYVEFAFLRRYMILGLSPVRLRPCWANQNSGMVVLYHPYHPNHITGSVKKFVSLVKIKIWQ